VPIFAPWVLARKQPARARQTFAALALCCCHRAAPKARCLSIVVSCVYSAVCVCRPARFVFTAPERRMPLEKEGRSRGQKSNEPSLSFATPTTHTHTHHAHTHTSTTHAYREGASRGRGYGRWAWFCGLLFASLPSPGPSCATLAKKGKADHCCVVHTPHRPTHAQAYRALLSLAVLVEPSAAVAVCRAAGGRTFLCCPSLTLTTTPPPTRQRHVQPKARAHGLLLAVLLLLLCTWTCGRGCTLCS